MKKTHSEAIANDPQFSVISLQMIQSINAILVKKIDTGPNTYLDGCLLLFLMA